MRFFCLFFVDVIYISIWENLGWIWSDFISLCLKKMGVLSRIVIFVYNVIFLLWDIVFYIVLYWSFYFICDLECCCMEFDDLSFFVYISVLLFLFMIWRLVECKCIIFLYVLGLVVLFFGIFWVILLVFEFLW